MSLQSGRGRFFLGGGEDARYLPGLVEYAFSSLTVSLWCFCVWGTPCKEFGELYTEKSAAGSEGDYLQYRAHKVYVRLVHNNKVQ